MIERYCSENIDNADPNVQATQLTMNLLRLHKLLFKPISATFCEDKITEELHQIQQAIKQSKNPLATFKSFAENLCLLEYLMFFNIKPQPMFIVDIDEKNDIRSLNHKKLLQSLFN